MKKLISIILLLCLFVQISAFADTGSLTKDVGTYLYETVKTPVVSSVGGEWTVIGLARSGLDIPDKYFENYYQSVVKQLKSGNGVLHNKKYTEYSRVILALKAMGKDPQNVAGYNLLTPLGDYEKAVWQGVNGAIWALIALDCGGYDVPKNPQAKTQATREMYINHILVYQTTDGGWALSGNSADPDVTGMALQALAPYKDNSRVKTAIEKGLACLSAMQNGNGGFSSYEEENTESSVQAIVALCSLGISIKDSRFVKNGKTILDNLLTFCHNGREFKHTRNGTSNLMATEQCFYALVALDRAEKNQNSLYNMSDAKIRISSDIVGLSGKNKDIRKMNITKKGKTFRDIAGHKYKNAIEALAEREIINGKTENTFEPNSTMTRAEFATIVSRGLGLKEKSTGAFDDVTKKDWFFGYVNTAYSYGIIKGASQKEFNPMGKITREEAAVIIARAAFLCGMNTQMNTSYTRDVLAQFSDYVKASSWAQGPLAFCYNEGILDDSVMKINPKEAVTRAEIASMLYNMLSSAQLI